MAYKDKFKKLESSREYYQLHKKEASEYYQSHKQEISKQRKDYYYIHKQECLEKTRKYYQSHKTEVLEYSSRYYQEHKLELKPHRDEYAKRYAQSHKTHIREYVKRYDETHGIEKKEYRRRYNLQLKLQVLTHYGNGRCVCVRCGNDGIKHLSIDHINGGGNKHRNAVDGIGNHIYRWLRDNNYPEGYQTLCMNCQFDKKYDDNEGYRGERMVRSEVPNIVDVPPEKPVVAITV